MKKLNYIQGWLLVFGMIFLTLTACNKNEDLVTENAMEGGLVVPTKVFNYKLGATPTVSIPITVPSGPGISRIDILSTYYDAETDTVSNTVLLMTITSVSSNVPVSMTYTELKKGIVLKGLPLPDDETKLAIGSSWKLTYTTYMAEDSRKVINNAVTTISVANAYAGKYNCVGIFHHPTAGDRDINEEKNLVPTGAYTVTTSVGDLGGNGYFMEITVNPSDNSVTVAALEGTPELLMTQGPNGEKSRYDPATKKFFIYY
jgi:hypothetical protein